MKLLTCYNQLLGIDNQLMDTYMKLLVPDNE